MLRQEQGLELVFGEAFKRCRLRVRLVLLLLPAFAVKKVERQPDDQQAQPAFTKAPAFT